MSAAGYTTIYNEVLRDRTLSLEAKGLFAVIKSFVGLPDFALSKRRLGYACSDSAYLLNAAWKELKQKGYLQHYFSQSENGAFCHVYNLMQHPSEPVDFVYSPSIDRPNGDVACISGAQRDYTNISTSVLRDKTISLASKGLFALVSHLMKIPDFVLRPEGIRAFCMEKIKHFSTLWKRFKISGLLKQHRFPSGQENHWTYEYKLCETPDLETPYLTNYHIDGSVSTVATIDGFLAKIKTQVSRIRKNVCVNKKDKPRTVRRRLRRQIEQQINADALRRQFGSELTGTVVTAVCNIKYADQLFIKGAAVTPYFSGKHGTLPEQRHDRLRPHRQPGCVLTDFPVYLPSEAAAAFAGRACQHRHTRAAAGRLGTGVAQARKSKTPFAGNRITF